MSSDLLFFSDPFFTGPSVDDNSFKSLDPFSSSSFFSFSPSITDFETQVQPMQNGPNLKSEFRDLYSLDGCEVKSEEWQIGVDYYYNQHQHFVPESYSSSTSGAESASKLMQRSLSCSSFNGKPGFLFDSQTDDILMNSPNFQCHPLSSPENSFFTAQLKRRVCSTGDLQHMKETQSSQSDSSLLQEANFKVGRYSAEERKEKISKYRAKRSQRKFNKTIKTLADNRTRIRGRFARNDDIPKAPPCLTKEEEGLEEFWVEFIEGLTRSF
ncbi:hypothetical protein RIF29_37447 [Crotalaria pallida]|uniref:CCT domain-containing protein n=1 Tax=Crotalaria pallida TaxID=3830 RepID=A0AAN9EEL6_CROPI